MTKINEHLVLVERQRRFEWELAREVYTRAAGQFVTGKTHNLLNLVQIVELAALELSQRDDATTRAILADLTNAAEDAKRQLTELMAVARPVEVIAPGARVGAAITAAVETVRTAGAIAVDLHLTVQAELTTRCSAAELEHMIYGLTLDAVAADPGEPPPAGEPSPSPSPSPSPIELFVRERVIDGKPWLEIVRGAQVPPSGDHFDLRAVEAIAQHNGGELARSERRGGGTELVVALPVVVAGEPAPR